MKRTRLKNGLLAGLILLLALVLLAQAPLRVNRPREWFAALNGIRFADQFPGATVGAQIDACLADSGPFTAGVCVVPPFMGAGAPSSVASNKFVWDLRGGGVSVGKWNDIRVVDENKFTTIQLALDDSGAVVVLVPENYAGADETSISDGQIIIDLRNGNLEVRARRTTTGAGEALIRVFEGANLSTTNPAANARVGIYSAVQATEALNAWGMNPLVLVQSGVSASINAIEANVDNRSNTAGGTAVGIHIVGESTLQADGAFRAISISEAGLTNDIRWKEAILINTGASDLGIVLNPLLAGNSQGSQAVRFVSVDGAGTSRTALMLTNLLGDLFLQTADGTAIEINRARDVNIRVGMTPDGGGFKHSRFGATCVTAATAGATCTTIYNWTVAFTDNSYTPVCAGHVPTGTPSLSTTAKPAGSVTVQVTAITAVASSFANVLCIAVHD